MATTTNLNPKYLAAFDEHWSQLSKAAPPAPTSSAAPVQEEPKPANRPQQELPKGCKWLSDALDVHTKVRVPLRVYQDTDWPEELRPFIPEPNPQWYWAPSQMHVAEAIARNLTYPNRPILVTGDAGVGKTAMDKEMCAIARVPYVRIGGSEGIEQSMLTGWNTVREGSMGWVEGIVAWVHRLGGRLSVDEIFKFPAPVVTGTFQWMLENDGKLLIADAPGTYADRLQKPGDTFRFLATDNVLGLGENSDKFAATHVQDTSTLDRFRYVVRMTYMTPGEETDMLHQAFPDVPLAQLESLTNFADSVRQLAARQELSVSLSARGLLGICQEYTEGATIAQAVRLICLSRLPDDAEVHAFSELYERAFGEKL